MTLSVDPQDRFWNEPPPTRSSSCFFKILRYVILGVFVLGLGAGGWKIYTFFTSSPREGNTLPFIKNDEGPYKVKAENQDIPGIHHQDKLVYSHLGGPQEGIDSTVEHILPDPDAPSVEMSQLYAPSEESLEDPTASIEVAASRPAPQSIDDLIGAEEGEEVASTAAKAQAPTEASPSAAPMGKVFIQLGSLKTQEAAEQEWKRAFAKGGALLKSLSPLIQRVDLGAEKGIYYRLRTGPFPSREAAQKACSALAEHKVSCFMVKTE